MARELPPLEPGWPPLTRRGQLAVRVALAVKRRGWTEIECAEALGVSIGVVRRLRNRANLIAVRITAKDFAFCHVCGKQLAIDRRRGPDYWKKPRFCLTPSTCRVQYGRRRATSASA